jgi:hypothetical protein
MKHKMYEVFLILYLETNTVIIMSIKQLLFTIACSVFLPCAVYAQGGDVEPNDTYGQAQLISSGQTVSGALDDADRTDWYKIVVPEEGKVTFSTHSDATLRLGSLSVNALVDGELRGRGSKDMDTDGKDTTIVHTVENMAAGTYYVYVPRYLGYGGYRLTYEFEACATANDSEPNGEYTEASLLESGATQPGRLGYDYWNSTDGTDWYKITLKSDGDIVFSTHSDVTLRLGSLSVNALVDGGLKFRGSKDMDAYGKDTTIVHTVGGLAAGTYYVYVPRYAGYGGYRLKYQFKPNAYSRMKGDNTTYAKRMQLAYGQEHYSTLGYDYWNSTTTEEWYGIDVADRSEISVTVSPDTTRTLNLGIVSLYRVEGTNDDGTPRLWEVASKRLERSYGTVSYMRPEGDAGDYVCCVRRSGGYGGYAISNGDARIPAGSTVHVSVEGRNTVRKGVPCEYKVTLSNSSSHRTNPFLLVIPATQDIRLIGFKMPHNAGTEYIPMEEVCNEDDSTAVFVVPRLDPWQNYSFTLIAEGVGDISYAKGLGKPKRVVVSGSALVAVAVMGFIGDAIVDMGKDKVTEYITTKVSKKILPPEQAREYAQAVGLTMEQLEGQSEQTGAVAYTVKSVVKTAATKFVERLPGGKIITTAGDIVEAVSAVVPSLRRRLWHWIYKEIGLIKDDNVDVMDAKVAVSDVVASWDPNEMVGPMGYGDENYIGETRTVNYRILFENKAEAGAPAYRVRIFDELDENVFDLESIQFGNTSHEGSGYNWEMKREGNRLSWDISGIELPPNVNAPEGEGYVDFSIDLKPGLPDGTVLQNKATIIFDKNTPIETNTYVNTLDLTPPVTMMNTAGYAPGDTVITVNFSSDDTGSGVDRYLLYVSKDGGEYTYYMQCNGSGTAFPVDPEAESKYSFYVLAIDNVGNTEQAAPAEVSVQTTTGIVDVMRPAGIEAADIYTTDGQRQQKLRQGVNILRSKDGKTRKVISR